MKKNNKNNLISISPPALPSESVESSPEPPVQKEETAISLSSSKILLSSPVPPVPEKIYHNADTCKAQILSENKNKSGIYK